MFRVIFCLMVAVSLSGCGGGGGIATNIQTLWVSPTSSGAGLIRAESNPLNGVAIVEDVNNSVKYQHYKLVEVITETRMSDGSYYGEAVVEWNNGSRANVLGRFYSESAAYVVVDDSNFIVYAGGSPPSNLPIGTYNYDGYNEVVYVYGGDLYNEMGDFELDVQFAARTAQLIADTDESRYIHDELKIDSTGKLYGVDGEFIVYDTDGITELESRFIDFHGTFHGSGADQVSGIAIGGTTADDDFSALVIVGQR